MNLSKDVYFTHPTTFKVDALGGVTCKLSFRGKSRSLKDGKYTLFVDKANFDKLPVHKEANLVPEVGQSIAERHNGP